MLTCMLVMSFDLAGRYLFGYFSIMLINKYFSLVPTVMVFT